VRERRPEPQAAETPGRRPDQGVKPAIGWGQPRQELNVPEDPQVSVAPAASPDAGQAASASAPEPAGELQVAFTSAPPGLRLAGEIDTTTRAAFARALALALQSSPGDVHADLGGVSFIDIDGLRTLVAAASAMGGDRMLVLNSTPAHVTRLLALTGWDEAPGLRIDAVTGRAWAASRTGAATCLDNQD